MDKIKSALIYVLGGVGSLVVVLQLFVWMSPASRAQEAGLEQPAVEAAAEPTAEPAVAEEPAAVSQPMSEQPAPMTMPVQAAPAPMPAPPALPALIDGVQPPQAGDFLAPYIFDTREGRRNPFRPMMLKDDDTDRAAIGPATPLERYDIDELKLVAIMWDVKSPRAMIMDPNKEIHILGKDDRLGRRQGYVATIREGELVVVETADFNGEVVYSTRIMRLEK